MTTDRSTDLVTAADVDALLAFLPGLRRPGRRFTVPSPDSSPYPAYAPDVLGFFRLAGRPPWCDQAYRPAEAARRLAQADLVARADLAQVRAMLTYCVRAERFGDGAWVHLLESGQLFRLLDRVRELRPTLE